MAEVWVPYWTRISEAGFDIPAVSILAQATLVQVVQCNLIFVGACVCHHVVVILFAQLLTEFFDWENYGT